MPILLEPRVGERPAGADSGEDLARAVLSLAAGDLGWRKLRGLGHVILDLSEPPAEASLFWKLGTEAAFVRINEEGFKKSLEGENKSMAPLDRLEKSRGSTFSKSSVSMASEAFLLTGELTEIAV
jgi:hypothetical protein